METTTKKLMEILRDCTECLSPSDYYCPVDEEHCEAIMAAIELIERTRPIPVSERLPEAVTEVLFYAADGDDGVWYTGFINTGLSWVDSSDTCEDVDGVTHWLPLPPSPA